MKSKGGQQTEPLRGTYFYLHTCSSSLGRNQCLMLRACSKRGAFTSVLHWSSNVTEVVTLKSVSASRPSHVGELQRGREERGLTTEKLGKDLTDFLTDSPFRSFLRDIPSSEIIEGNLPLVHFREDRIVQWYPAQELAMSRYYGLI
jgi:hypothetical protein